MDAHLSNKIRPVDMTKEGNDQIFTSFKVI
jgi:hypothetical protein